MGGSREIAIREVVAVVLAADSPAGRVADVLDDLAAHLPPPAQQWGCSLCRTECWPCAGFDAAAQKVIGARLRLAEFVPLDLHPRLWPPPEQSQDVPQPSPPQSTLSPGTWFDEESRH
ncbi:hypothetical protein SK571_30970 [Lentzea sp. BCCO 10_0798]|uniref:Uncharacterized protein n=1 Tax=Lentzea kristufekii TaxID=3095430 RepID=A0ABU4TZS1_9PSEU|nr:hypothetical protein [Lentzea sp. BCCO 10_0798]MDX8053813.1 hypothetical protein [Lentzea sp. BCCO 10_0798]